MDTMPGEISPGGEGYVSYNNVGSFFLGDKLGEGLKRDSYWIIKQEKKNK